MNHLRRSVLAGKTLSYMTYATVRGAIRRNDPDGVSAAPYFPVSMGDTLMMSVNGAAPVVATFPASNSSIDTVLASLNTALTGVGKAYEQGGVIYLQTTTAGGDGSIEVTGGTGATALGFDLSGGQIKAIAGDILGAPDGRVENPYDASFPVFGENLDTESVVRSLSGIAGNVDLLHGDATKDLVQAQKVCDIVAANHSADMVEGNPVSHVHVTVPVYCGAGEPHGTLSSFLPKYFTVFDKTSGRASLHQILDVVSSPSGASLLGTQQEKGTLTITAIQKGCILVLSSSVADIGVRPGDYVDIEGTSVSTSPWDNRGLRWVVVQVIGTSQVMVRPMTSSELVLQGVSSTVAQHFELNDQKEAGQTYGTARFIGPFFSSSYVRISPQITDATLLASSGRYELWAPTPTSLRGATPSFAASFMDRLAGDLWSSLTEVPVQVELLSQPGLALGGSITSTEFEVMLNGRVFNVPASSFARPSSNSWLFFDGVSRTLQLTNTWDPGAPSTVVVGYYDNGAGTLTPIGPIQAALSKRTVTVGTQGNFSTLQAAVSYATALISAGSSRMVDIVIVDPLTLSAAIPITVNGIRIRGMTAGTALGRSGGISNAPMFTFPSGSRRLFLEDLAWDAAPLEGTGGFVSFSNTVGTSGGVTGSGVATGTQSYLLFRTGAAYLWSDSLTMGGSSVGIVASVGDINVVLTSGHSFFVNTQVTAGVLASSTNILAGTTDGSYVLVGSLANASAGARLTTVGGMGYLFLGKTSATQVSLSRDALALLVGGPASDAQSQHTHGNLAAASHTHAASAISAPAFDDIDATNVQDQLQEIYEFLKYPGLRLWSNPTVTQLGGSVADPSGTGTKDYQFDYYSLGSFDSLTSEPLAGTLVLGGSLQYGGTATIARRPMIASMTPPTGQWTVCPIDITQFQAGWWEGTAHPGSYYGSFSYDVFHMLAGLSNGTVTWALIQLSGALGWYQQYLGSSSDGGITWTKRLSAFGPGIGGVGGQLVWGFVPRKNGTNSDVIFALTPYAGTSSSVSYKMSGTSVSGPSTIFPGMGGTSCVLTEITAFGNGTLIAWGSSSAGNLTSKTTDGATWAAITAQAPIYKNNRVAGSVTSTTAEYWGISGSTVTISQVDTSGAWTVLGTFSVSGLQAASYTITGVAKTTVNGVVGYIITGTNSASRAFVGVPTNLAGGQVMKVWVDTSTSIRNIWSYGPKPISLGTSNKLMVTGCSTMPAVGDVTYAQDFGTIMQG